MDAWAAGTAAGTSDLQLNAADIELTTSQSLRGVESKHFAAKQVFTAGDARRKGELVGHVVCTHDFVGPFAIDIVQLVDLDPSTNTSGLRRVGDRFREEMRDGAGMARLVPFDLDLITSFCFERQNTGWNLASTDIAGHVVASNIFHGAVGRRHPDTDLISWCLIIDPDLMKILMGSCGRKEGESKKSFGEHVEKSE